MRNISFKVDGKKILNDISLTMENSRFTVIIGSSGGGRLALARLIMGIERPTGREVLFDGEDITAMSIDERAKRKIGYTFQQLPRFKGTSVREPLSLAHGKDLDEEVCCSYLTDVGLCSKDYLNRGVDAPLFGGEVKRAEIVSILARGLKPSISGEPEAGIDLWNFAKLVEIFQKLQREFRQSVILISHQERIMQPVDEIIIIENGAIETKEKRDDIPPSLVSELGSCEFEKQVKQMGQMEKNLLKTATDISDFMPGSTPSLRRNGTGVERHSTEHVKILAKTDKPGIDIIVDANVAGENIYIPVILTDSDIQDMVCNNFYIGEGADVEIVAGCDIHNDGYGTSQRDGICTSHIGRNANITYTEKCYGKGSSSGGRVLDPVTVIHMEEGSFAKMDMSQVKRADSTFRKMEVSLGASTKLATSEKLITYGKQKAHSGVTTDLNEEGSVAQIVSRSVGKDTSVQVSRPIAVGNNHFRVHTQCDSIIMGEAKIGSMPEIATNHVDVEIIHKAIIGEINSDRLVKLQTFGLNSEEVEEVAVDGFLR